MGYYVTLSECNALIPTENIEAAYAAACALNTRNDLKRGGTWPREEVTDNEPHPNIWFSWMDWNYPETCPDLITVLRAVGFEVSEEKDGLSIWGYDNKTGCEEYFIQALAPYLRSTDGDDPVFVWRGEDGAIWRNIIREGVFRTEEGRVVFG